MGKICKNEIKKRKSIRKTIVVKCITKTGRGVKRIQISKGLNSIYSDG